MVKIKYWYFLLLLIIVLFVLFIFDVRSFYFSDKVDYNAGTGYEYEICDEEGCRMIPIDKIILPSEKTFYICNNEGERCEDVPVNRLLLKEGTDKKYCSNAPYLKTDYVDNWWNANGLIDECEMPPNSDMQFAFKLHNQTLISYTGTVQISLTVINYEDNHIAIQVLTAEDNDKNNLPDKWVHCGNLDGIKGKDVKIILCSGKNLKFVKLVNAEWNPMSIFLDRIEILVEDKFF